MDKTKRPSLVSKILTITTLAGALSGSNCYLTAEEGLGAALDILGSSGAIKNNNIKNVVSKGSDLSYKAGERRAKHEIELKEADVDIYKEKGLSNIRVDEEKALRNMYETPSSPTTAEQLTDSETQKVMEEVLGKKQGGINYRAIIDAVQKEYLTNPKDYERNLGMIDRALKLEGLTSDDKSRLVGILDNSISDIIKSPTDARSIDGRISVLKYGMNLQEFSPANRTRIGRHFPRLADQKLNLTSGIDNKIDIIRKNLADIKEIKKNIQFSKAEYDIFYRDSSGITGTLEARLRQSLEQKDKNDFSVRLEKLKESIRECKKFPINVRRTVKQKNLMGLAEEIGCTTILRSELKLDESYDRYELSDEPIKQEIDSEKLKNFIESCIRRGIEEWEIRNFLLSDNYAKDQITPIFNEVREESEKKTEQQIRSKASYWWK